MQSFDGDKLISTDQGDMGELNKKMDQLNELATHHVIGKLPSKGATIELNGLKYKITYVDKIMGKFHAKILKP